MALFRCWLRSCCEVTMTPDGTCVSRTAISVLLTCWPPGPLERKVSTSHSRSKSSSDSGKRIIFASRLRSADYTDYAEENIETNCVKGRRREKLQVPEANKL